MLTAIASKLLGRQLSWRIGRSLYLSARGEASNGISENGEAQLIRSAISAWRARSEPGAFVAFDIGGHLGEWSSTFIREIGESPYRLEVFEPAPTAANHLAQVVGSVPNVTINRCAVSSEDGETTMHLVAPTAGTNSLDARPTNATEAVQVKLVTLEGFMQRGGIDTVHLVKMDTEGHDIQILRSNIDFLKSGKIELLQFEYNHRWLQNQGSLFEVFQLIKDIPYKLGRVVSGGVDLFDHWNPEIDRFFEANYVLVRNDRVDAIGARSLTWNVSNVSISRN